MWKQIGCAVAVAAGAFLLLPRAGANRNFAPDWTFQGSSLAAARMLGSAEWKAENGEIVGTPKTGEGGWLILDKPLQDVQFAATFRCTGGCRAGVMLRAQSTPEGMQGIYVALPEGENPAGAFALKLDRQGLELSREKLKPAMGTVRFIVPPPADGGRGGAPAAPGGAPGPGRAGAGRGGPGRFGGGLPPNAPYTRPDYSYKPNEWSPLEIILDANYLRMWINNGPEAGTTNGRADEDYAKYGPVALYVGGSGEVRFNQIELKDLGRRLTRMKKSPAISACSALMISTTVGPRLRRMSITMASWIFCPGLFTIWVPITGFHARSISSKTNNVVSRIHARGCQFRLRLHGRWMAGLSRFHRARDGALREPERRAAPLG